MCFFTSIGIDSLAINGIVLPVEAFTVLLIHFILILFLKIKTNCKRNNNNNSRNATKVYEELTSRASATRVHNWLGFEGSPPL
jgi:hypothetical protein